MTNAENTSRWARRFVLAGAGFLLLWQLTAVAGTGRRTSVVLGVLGFVFHTIFGKAYSLVPAYFDRNLVTSRAMPVHFVCAVSGTVLLTIDAETTLPFAGWIGSLLWCVGVATFLGTLLWSVRDNLAGRETGTGTANAEREDVDRIANAGVPIAFAYLALGSYALLATHTPLPLVFDGYLPRVSHLLAAGAATLLFFAVGFRLLPRFLVATPPKPLVWTVLSAGAIGPLLIAGTLPAGFGFRLGAAIQAIAIVGFAVAFSAMFVKSDRERVGFYGVLMGTWAGVVAAALGISFAFGRITPPLVTAHLRLNVLGFLGLSIVGATYQFYPPAVGTFRGASNRSAIAAIALLAVGLLVDVVGALAGVDTLMTIGRLGTVTGALVHVYLLVELFRERYG